MRSHQTARLVGALFGLVFIVANAGALPAGVGVPLRGLAIAAVLVLFFGIRRLRGVAAEGDAADLPGDAGDAGADTAPRRFGRGYRLVVAAEVVAGLGGLLALNPVLHVPDASVPWIALVVGAHFFGLAAVWSMPSLNRLAAALSLCGALGLVMAAAGLGLPVIAAVSGITPGVLLMGSVWWSLRAVPGAHSVPAHQT
ncbi:hypothetical protein [Streptomyces sp. NBC_00096]|uniref:hypothetical protein n=1 Tax=Streptomyces sp. NBC_00096 TaxID=2975650 RepID=UPI003255D9CC